MNPQQNHFFDWGDDEEKAVYVGLEMAEERSAHAKAMNEANQKQVGGDHYKSMAIQPVEYIHANNLNFLQGSVIKYISRYKAKNGKQDLEKAKHFIDLLIELEYK